RAAPVCLAAPVWLAARRSIAIRSVSRRPFARRPFSRAVFAPARLVLGPSGGARPALLGRRQLGGRLGPGRLSWDRRRGRLGRGGRRIETERKGNIIPTRLGTRLGRRRFAALLRGRRRRDRRRLRRLRLDFGPKLFGQKIPMIRLSAIAHISPNFPRDQFGAIAIR